MGGFQPAVIGEHSALVAQHSVYQPPVSIVSERQVREQIDEDRNDYEEDQAKQDSPSYIRRKAAYDMGMRDAGSLPRRILCRIEILPVPAPQGCKEKQRKPCPGIDARPFGGDGEPHADAAGAQGKPGLA